VPGPRIHSDGSSSVHRPSINLVGPARRACIFQHACVLTNPKPQPLGVAEATPGLADLLPCEPGASGQTDRQDAGDTQVDAPTDRRTSLWAEADERAALHATVLRFLRFGTAAGCGGDGGASTSPDTPRRPALAAPAVGRSGDGSRRQQALQRLSSAPKGIRWESRTRLPLCAARLYH
jgi:hypothetical protein